MPENNVLVRLAAVVFTILLLSAIPLTSVRAEPWPGGTVEPATTVANNTTTNTTIPEAVTPTHYAMAAGVLLFFIFMMVAIVAIRGG